MSRMTRTALWIFAAALLVRLFCLAAVLSPDDQVDYYEDVLIASNLLQGRGYSLDFSMRNYLFYEVLLGEKLENPVEEGARVTALKTPVYPLLVCAVFALFGAKNFLALFVLQALAASAGCALFYSFLRECRWSGAIWGGLAAALYPPFVYHSVTRPESTFVLLCLLSLFLLLLVRLSPAGRGLQWLGAGLLMGLLILTDPVVLAFVVPAAVYRLIMLSGGFKGLIANAVWTFSAAALVMLPWTIRNALVFDRWIPLKTPVGQNFARGLTYSDIRLPRQELLELELRGRSLNEAEEDEAIRRLAARRLKGHEWVWLNSLPRNFANYWWEPPRYRHDDSIRYLVGRKIPYLVLLAAGVPALLASLVRWGARPRDVFRQEAAAGPVLLLGLVGAYTVVHTVYGAWNLRYHFPVELALCAFGARSVAWAWTHARSSSAKGLTTPRSPA